MKKQVTSVDATPSKRLYLSIIADYDVYMAICELIDNALDIWVNNGRKSKLDISILLDQNQQRIEVIDNAGGIDESEISNIVGPGHTSNVGSEETIGIFGVGTKRAVVALAQDVLIRTRKKSQTFMVEFDDDWIKDSEEWYLPVYQVDNLPSGNTQIELTKLRKVIDEHTRVELADRLGTVYAKFFEYGKVEISINDKIIVPRSFNDWAFPPGFEPRHYTGKVITKDGSEVKVEAIGGLTTTSSPAGGEYGVYFYCNDRLIARALKTYDVGFATGLAGKPHADISLVRLLISLNGAARLMPWNSSKSNLNPSHEVFIAIRNWLLQVVKDYSSLARRLSKYEGGWPENVFKYQSGNVADVQIEDFPQVNTSYLPPLPKVQARYSRIVEEANRGIGKKKPWTVGLYESVIAVDWILKQRFEQKNRIALILLDSTLEIAFKEFLVNESGQRYSNKRLQGMFSDRTQVHSEVKKYLNISNSTWQKIDHYYDIRNQMIHRRAAAGVSDVQIKNFRAIVEDVLTKMFGLQFHK